MTGQDTTRGIARNVTSYGDAEFSKYMRRAFLASAGFDAEDLDRPIVGIVDTSSDYNTCHRQMPEMIAAIKRGVLEAGGCPFAFPTISLHEILTSPTTMLFRNLAAMDTEEMIAAQPMDAVVMMGGCDKTVPAQLMAAASANVPAISVVSGPMLTGYWRGERLGACTDCRRYWAQYRAGQLSEQEIRELEQALCFTGGTCMVMGTASTMACLTEAMGLMLPGGATPPMSSGERLRHCVAAGRCAVDIARVERRPRDILTRAAFLNALDDFDAVSRRVPLLVDCKPAGKGYLEDMHFAGGMPALLKALEPLLDVSAMTITGRTLGEYLREVPPPGSWQTTIRTLDHPLGSTGALAIVKGSLAPDGAVLKTAAASKDLLCHRGPAVVFESPEDAIERIDDPALGITQDHVMVLRNAGPVGAGMPEAASLPIPKYLAREGVKDMVRVSDARMSGTAYGTVVLHCSPESAVGGPLALVRDGDLISLDLDARRIDLLVDESELARRREAFMPPPLPPRGWRRLYAERVLPSHLGADLDFL
ncbi:MAG: dihydroxy-acid dehydratase [Candidatus Hydrogenedentes bacterium]|nr:dihydroxy-acid dehydratase [Candidatus Hydrogenedentota bacterium]